MSTDTLSRVELAQEIRQRIDGQLDGLPIPLPHIESVLDVWSGRVIPACDSRQEVASVWCPELCDTPWLSLDQFQFVPALIASYPTIKQEFDAYVGRGGTLPPYPTHPTRRDTDWARGWHGVHLCLGNRDNDELCTAFPASAALLAQVKSQHRYVQQFAFLILRPGIALPLHTDRPNYLVSVHLGIDCPPSCGLEVGGEARTIDDGACVAFDNSFLHRAWNDDESRWRVVLAIHLLHPRLTPLERQLLSMVHPLLMTGVD